MTEEDDILNIDNRIKETFDDRVKMVPVLTKKVKDLILTLNSNNLNKRLSKKISEHINTITTEIKDIKSMHEYNFYIAETAELIEKYKNILKTPMKVSFVSEKKIKNKEKDEIIYKYIQKAQKYITRDITNLFNLSTGNNKIICTNCGNKKQFDVIDECIYVCINCGSQQEILLHTSSYKDIDRVNISSKYTYDRKVHFRDCMNQYQGKQNSTIDKKIYKDLEDQFEKHHLLCKGSTKKRFRKINKDHIHLFLKELEYTKHYENINLIHYNMTGKKPDDISHLEDDLLNDFDLLTDLYDKNYKNKKDFVRKNFINTQYVLYQLLTKYKHPCKKDDFTILKTVDRKSFHDTISSDLFSQLGWSFTPLF